MYHYPKFLSEISSLDEMRSNDRPQAYFRTSHESVRILEAVRCPFWIPRVSTRDDSLGPQTLDEKPLATRILLHNYSKHTRTNPGLCWGNTTILISGKEWKKLKLIIKEGVDCIPVPEKCPRIERFVEHHLVEALFLKMRGWRAWLGRFGGGKLKEKSIFWGFAKR